MKTDEFKGYVDGAVSTDGVKVSPFTTGFLPYVDSNTRGTELCAAFFTRVKDERVNPATEHTVVMGFRMKDGEPDYLIWCSDKYLEGKNLTKTEAEERVDAALTMLPSAGRKEMRKKMLEDFNIYTPSGECNFFKVLRRDGTLCAHTSTALRQMQDARPAFMDDLQATYDTALAGATAATVLKGATMTLEELAFRTPVLIEGDRGSGKTTEVRQFVRAQNLAYVEMGGHEGIEAPDLLGFLVPYKGNEMVWKDGPLSEAFRKARKEKVVFLMDEILRIPTRELSILLTALSPDQGTYRLRTGRILSVEDGVATEETLECPKENLCVVATTNVGAEYAVDEVDPAVAERFIVLRKDTELEALKTILASVAKPVGLGAKVVKATLDFFVKMRDAQLKGLVYRCPTTRTLTRAFELSDGDGKEVLRALKTQSLLWVARTSEGQPVPEQVKSVSDLLDVCFKSV